MATYEAESAELVKIRNLNSYSRRVYTIVKVVSKTEAREVSGGARRVVEALVGDDTASIYLTLWDDAIDKVKEGQILNIKNAYVNLFRGSMRLNLGRFGSYELAESAPFEEVNLDNNLSSKVFERRSYDRGGFGGRDRRYGGERGRRNFRSGRREMHKAVCADCGKECEVPFKPTEGRPVYCQECFAKRRPPRRW
jgi:replication factor A1